ncbi:RNA-binding protein [Candidatus Woesearchaeota archaeon]|nr:RNA-binding protein [Nanoarchaeota archaeon]MCB9370311.1 RNA-binding protein [Candidatus Woesearchaeota archaeon]USN44949.1 MAG: RNA-binding protein [Candidatus Woesearchaeota archaeon]
MNDSADITFDCPKCGFKSISRSRKARQLSKPYTCPKCGFIGP